MVNYYFFRDVLKDDEIEEIQYPDKNIMVF